MNEPNAIGLFARTTVHECGYVHKPGECTHLVPLEFGRGIIDTAVCNGCHALNGRWYQVAGAPRCARRLWIPNGLALLPRERAEWLCVCGHTKTLHARSSADRAACVACDCSGWSPQEFKLGRELGGRQ